MLATGGLTDRNVRIIESQLNFTVFRNYSRHNRIIGKFTENVDKDRIGESDLGVILDLSHNLCKSRLDSVSLVGLFPCNAEVFSSHVTISRKLSVLGLSEVKHFDNSSRTKVEYL